jgi:LmbE family N-acetylglucosaminyl deacetylase
MVFAAHADDVEQIAGGRLAKYIHARGYEGIYVSAINNTAGCLLERAPGGSRFTVSNSPKTYPVDALETIQIRTEEARQAAAVLGAIPVFLNFRETWIWMGRKPSYIGTEEFHRYNPPGRQVISVATRLKEDIEVVVRLFDTYKPEIVIIHTMGGEKHDHGNSGYLAYLAFREAIARGVPVGKLWMKSGEGWLAEPEAIRRGRGKPDVRIDVTDFARMKYEALRKHVSQKSGRLEAEAGVLSGKKYYEEFITVIDNISGQDRPGL